MENSSPQTIQLDCAFIKKISKHLITIKHSHDYFIELNDAIEINTAFEKLSENNYFYAIIDTNKRFSSFSKAAFKYLASEAPIIKKKKLKATFIIVDGLPNRLLAKFFNSFYKPSYPMVIVSSKKEALKKIDILSNKKAAL